MKQKSEHNKILNDETMNFDEDEIKYTQGQNLFNIDESGIDQIDELNEAQNRYEASRSYNKDCSHLSKANMEKSGSNHNEIHSRSGKNENLGHGMNTSSKGMHSKNKTTLSTNEYESHVLTRNMSNNQNDNNISKNSRHSHENSNMVNKLRTPEQQSLNNPVNHNSEKFNLNKPKSPREAQNEKVLLVSPKPFKFQDHAKRSIPNMYLNSLRGINMAKDDLGLIYDSHVRSSEKKDVFQMRDNEPKPSNFDNFILHEQDEKSESDKNSGKGANLIYSQFT